MDNAAKLRWLHVSARWLWVGLAVTLLVAAVISADRWLPAARALLSRMSQQGPGQTGVPAGDEDHRRDHDDDHAGHDETNSLHLSEQARKNIGLKLVEVNLQPYERTITVPGMVVERPGRSKTEITAPFAGVVTRIYPLQGEAVEPQQPLFEMRLTHEDLVQTQSEFLRTAEELDVIRREVQRIEKITDGAIAGKSLLERKYEQQRQEAILHAQRQALLLHGLSEKQVDNILKERTLLQTLTVHAPPAAIGNDPSTQHPELLQVQDLRVEQGQHVEAGATLCSLVNHSELYIEGKAFEQDAEEINQAAAQGWHVSALVESQPGSPRLIEGLAIQHVAGRVDEQSRALHFYVTLPNKLLRETTSGDGRKFVYWQYLPGQRMQIRVPIEKWEERIVLPVDAVAHDGVETYVFQPNGDHFDRIPVHLEYRDQVFAVIANDGSIFPGDTVAASAAHQMQMALKNESGGAIDAHAGHSH